MKLVQIYQNEIFPSPGRRNIGLPAASINISTSMLASKLPQFLLLLCSTFQSWLWPPVPPSATHPSFNPAIAHDSLDCSLAILTILSLCVYCLYLVISTIFSCSLASLAYSLCAIYFSFYSWLFKMSLDVFFLLFTIKTFPLMEWSFLQFLSCAPIHPKYATCS